MASYLVIQADVTDWERFKAYTSKVPALVRAYGGEYIAMDNQHDVLEGDYKPGSVVISRWPDEATIRAFWQSDSYQQLIALRDGTGHFHVMLVHGLNGNSK